MRTAMTSRQGYKQARRTDRRRRGCRGDHAPSGRRHQYVNSYSRNGGRHHSSAQRMVKPVLRLMDTPSGSWPDVITRWVSWRSFRSWATQKCFSLGVDSND